MVLLKKTISSDHCGQNHDSIPIKMVDMKNRLNKNCLSSLSIRRLQFHLTLSWACTVHKVQGKNFPKIVVCFDLAQQRRFNPGQAFAAFRRVTSVDGLYLTWVLIDFVI